MCVAPDSDVSTVHLVGAFVGALVGAFVGAFLGAAVGAFVGTFAGAFVGASTNGGAASSDVPVAVPAVQALVPEGARPIVGPQASAGASTWLR